jgi:hypothetical protein
MADRESCIGPEAAADYVQTEAPRLIKVAGVTAISFGLWDGANRALSLANQEDVHADAWQTALGYRGDTISLTVVRLALLLDRDPTVVSFQRIYTTSNVPMWLIYWCIAPATHQSWPRRSMTELPMMFALRLKDSSKPIQQSTGMISTVASNISAIAASCTLPPNRSRSVCPMRRSEVWCTP